MFTPLEKRIDASLSPALIRGGEDAREFLARCLWKHRADKEAVAFIQKVANFTGYPSKINKNHE